MKNLLIRISLAQLATRIMLAVSTLFALTIGVMFGISALVYQGLYFTTHIKHNQPD